MQVRPPIVCLVLLSCAVGQFPLRAQEDQSPLIRITAGDREQPTGLVSCRVPENSKLGDDLQVVRSEDGKRLTAQRSAIDPDLVWWSLEKPLPAGTTRDYRLVAAEQASPTRVTCRDEAGKLLVSAGERPLLTYHHQVARPPVSMPAYYQRSGFIHPLQTPSGRMVTDDFPPDHPHQHGVFRAWVDTEFRGRKVDFWNQQSQTGNVRHKSIRRLASGPLFAEFAVELEHVMIQPDQEPVVVLNEEWSVRAFPQGDLFVVDIHSKQKASTSDPLLIHTYHYGGLAIRGHRNWDAQSGFDFVTSEGLGREAGNHTRPTWVMMPGQVDGGDVFSLTMGHPTNFRHPQPVRLHPTMPYFCFAPMVLGEFSLTDQAFHEAQFRLIVGDGQLSAAAADSLWADYSQELMTELK